MVPDDKKEKELNIELNEAEALSSEEAEIQAKIDAFMRAKAKELVAKRIQEEKEARLAEERAKEEQEQQQKEALKQEAIARAYARYLIENSLKPGDATFVNPEELGLEQGIMPVPEVEEIEFDEDELQAAIEKAEEIEEQSTAQSVELTQAVELEAPVDMKPTDPEKEPIVETAAADAKTEMPATAEMKTEMPATAARKPKKSKFSRGFQIFLAAPVEVHDRLQNRIDKVFIGFGRGLARELHRVTIDYRNSRREIGKNLLTVCVLCALIVTLLDYFTVYEYAYNGKALGYVASQDDVTNVLTVAGEQLNEVNEDSSQDIEFSAGENISFKLVDGTQKDVDDVDTTVNKLAYMTDIEVEAYGIYDGSKLVTIVKSQSDAESLLEIVKGILGQPDEGMTVESVDFENPLEIKPINILLTTVQSSSAARKQMVDGGEAKYYHLVEKGETKESIMTTFGVDEDSLYDSSNKEKASSFEEGEKICIRKTVEPVSVKLVETGKMKETVEYETIKKNSKDYYKGDEVVSVEGVDGIQIFEGTVTKVGGKVVERDTSSLEVIREKVDKVILVGTAKRPKTAPTGIFKNPMITGTYTITSRVGPRWGRTHSGIDMAGSVGTDILASDGGTVIRAEYYGGYGLCVDIQHKEGWISRYGHMSSIGVKAGDKVYQGQYIGAVGSTGHSTGPHLHFEIQHNGSIENPEALVKGGL